MQLCNDINSECGNFIFNVRWRIGDWGKLELTDCGVFICKKTAYVLRTKSCTRFRNYQPNLVIYFVDLMPTFLTNFTLNIIILFASKYLVKTFSPAPAKWNVWLVKLETLHLDFNITYFTFRSQLECLRHFWSK